LGRAWPALDIHVPGCDAQLQELVLAELDDFQPTAIQELDETTARLRAFFTSADSRDAAAHALAVSFGSHLFVETISVEDEDWAARSQAQLRAIAIGRIVVAPPWETKRLREPFSEDTAEKGSRSLFVIIQPSMGFGTGHHATTRLVLSALQTLPLDDRAVLDIGCGSGVLAIAAVTLGARWAVAVDLDPDALENARENIELNNVGDRVRLEEADFREMTNRADVVVANLTGALLEQSAPTLAGLVEPGGCLIVSGFMESERTRVLQALEQSLTLKTTAQEDEWVCAALVKTPLADWWIGRLGDYRSRQR
jgi:ribosomal protein L11 methyltransferase